MKKRVLMPLLFLAGLSGCTQMQPGLGFDDVKQSVSQRTGGEVHWNTGSPEDAQVKAAVSEMLSKDLSAEEAVQVALLSNRELQAVYEELNIAQADVVQAGLLKNPVFSGEFRVETGGAGGNGPGIVLDVAQDFVSLLSMPLRKSRAQAAFEATKLRVTADVLDLAFDVRTSFYDYQAAEQTREMRGTVLEAMAASYDLSKRLRQAGNNRDLDVSNERAMYEQAKVDLAAAEATVVAARERMNALMGLWGEAAASWRTAHRLPSITDEEIAQEGLERKAIDASLDLGVLRREAEIAARTAGIARPFAWLDDAEIGVAAERETDGQWSVGPSLSVPIPIFDQGQAKIAEAQARYRQASERTIARAVEIRSRVRAAYSALQSAHDRARYYEKVMLPLRGQIVGQTQLQYNGMQVSAFQLLQSKRDQVETGAQYVSALHEYWEARATLNQILAGRMTPFEQSSIGSFTMGTSSGSAADGDHR